MGFLATHLHLGVRGAVRVELEKDTLLPGDVLVGSVVVRIAKRLDAVALKVRVRGRQLLHWTTSSGDAMIANTKKIDHLLEEVVLVCEDVALDVGESRYPFTVLLPDDLQHNFEYKCRRIEELQGVRVCVEYDVEAVLTVKGVGVSDLSGTATFQIEPLPMAVPFGRRVTAAREDTVRFMAMFQRGSCHVALSMNTDVLDAASTIEGNVSLTLNTTQILKYVVLVLYEDVLVNRHAQSFPGRKQGTRAICSRKFDRKTILATHPVVDNVVNMQLQLPITPQTLSKTESLHPTMNSFFVNVSYHVAVEVKFPLSPRICVHAPMTILPRLVAPRELEVTAVTDTMSDRESDLRRTLSASH